VMFLLVICLACFWMGRSNILRFLCDPMSTNTTHRRDAVVLWFGDGAQSYVRWVRTVWLQLFHYHSRCST
jgi:hypothetical protein